MLEQFVTELLDSLEGDLQNWRSKEISEATFGMAVELLIRSIRAGIKASQSIPKPNQPTQILDKLAEVKRQEEVAYLQHVENNGVRMVELIDGTNGPVTFFEIENKMPVNARMFINGRIYQLQQDGKMHYMKEETELHRKKSG